MLCFAHTRARISCTLLFSVGLLASVQGQPAPEDPLAEFVQAREWIYFLEAYNRIFDNASRQQLEQLLVNEHDSVALAAGWVLAVKRLDAGVENAAERADGLSRFVGLVEGRLRVVAPEAWVAGVQSLEYPGGIFKVPLAEAPAEGLAERPENHPERLTVRKRADGSWEVKGATTDLRFPGDVMEEELEPYMATAVSGGQLIFVAVYEKLGSPYMLYALDPRTRSRTWKARVWSSQHGGTTGTGYQHQVQLVVVDDRVVVFGVSTVGAYVEVFDRATGDPLMRFATSYHRVDAQAPTTRPSDHP